MRCQRTLSAPAAESRSLQDSAAPQASARTLPSRWRVEFQPRMTSGLVRDQAVLETRITLPFRDQSQAKKPNSTVNEKFKDNFVKSLKRLLNKCFVAVLTTRLSLQTKWVRNLRTPIKPLHSSHGQTWLYSADGVTQGSLQNLYTRLAGVARNGPQLCWIWLTWPLSHQFGLHQRNHSYIRGCQNS